jgi:hypothetical protein
MAGRRVEACGLSHQLSCYAAESAWKHLATGAATLGETLDTRPQRAWVALVGLLSLLEAPSALAHRTRESGPPQRPHDQEG